MPVPTMLFHNSIVLPFRYPVLPKYAFCSKLSAVKSSKTLRIEVKENHRQQRKIDMTQFLLKECGLSDSQISVIGRKHEELFKVKSLRRAQQAVQLFRDSGFTEDQVRKIIFKSPKSLTLKVDKLKTKIEFTKTLGFTGSDLGHFISQGPVVLCYNLDGNIKPKISLLLGVFGSKDNLCKTLMLFPWVLFCKLDDLKPKIDILKQSGMQDELLLYVIMLRPPLILRREETLKLEIEYVRNLGFSEGTKTFAGALAVVDAAGLENFKNKIKHMATYGLLENDILQMVRSSPRSLNASIDKMDKIMDYLRNIAGFQPNIVLSYPNLLSYSLEKRILPRHKVIEFLRETDPSRLPKTLVTVYTLSERCFVDKFLMGSPEAAKLYDKYKGNSFDLAIS